MMDESGKLNSRSQDFRYFYANTFGLTFGTGEVMLVFGIQHNPGSTDTAMEEQGTLIINHASAKLLSEIFKLLIEDYEEATQAIVPIEDAKLAPLRDIIAQAKAQRGKLAEDSKSHPSST